MIAPGVCVCVHSGAIIEEWLSQNPGVHGWVANDVEVRDHVHRVEGAEGQEKQ